MVSDNQEALPAIQIPDLRNDVFQQMLGDEVTMALSSLEDNYRIVFILCVLEDFKYDEIAAILDIPIGTVRSRLHRSRNKLKKALSEYGKSRGYHEGNDVNDSE